jgi:uncharacterized C2H2 Zn-finger protein
MPVIWTQSHDSEIFDSLQAEIEGRKRYLCPVCDRAYRVWGWWMRHLTHAHGADGRDGFRQEFRELIDLFKED